MKRLLVVLVFGAGVMYFLDPASGEQRRQRALHLWRQNKDDILDGARAASAQVTAASHQAVNGASKVASAVGERAQ